MVYSCTATVGSPYLTDDFPATQGTPLDVVVESKYMLSLTRVGTDTFTLQSVLIYTDDQSLQSLFTGESW